MAIAPAHRRLLESAAITPEVIDASGIMSTPKGDTIMFPWTDGGPTVWQARPDEPGTDESGEPLPKYRFPKGTKIPLNRLRDDDTYQRVIIAEGTKQQYAVLSHAPKDFAVYGLAGAENFRHTDMGVFQDREVWLLLDADFRTNSNVYAAAERITEHLKLGGATAVHYVSTPGSGKEGVDDVLAKLGAAKRGESLRRWLSLAEDKLGKRPRAKKPAASELDTEAAKMFKVRDKPVVFQPLDAALKILADTPAAITREDTIALYRNGVYEPDKYAVTSALCSMLGNFYSPGYVAQTTDVMYSILAGEGRILPEQQSAPLLNCPNGMVDLRTGELSEHSPDHLSYRQVTVVYDPDCATPTYDAWLRASLRKDGATDAEVEALVQDIEETAATMLDPSRTPSKTLFLFGPSRSGKSTFLRLLRAVAGAANTSAVTLHNLATDQFAAANLYGKMLNVAADLSNKHVEDLSLFKMITGEDVVQANRKYGNQFEFTNQALVAFSANELPTVSEASRAYAERMKPFSFPNSFAGREDRGVEDKLTAELPGILARWVAAAGRFIARGRMYAATDAATRAQFEANSDRVVQFFQDMVTVHPAQYGDRVDTGASTGRRDTALAFNAWAERNGSSKMGERAFFQRFGQIPGVTEVKAGAAQRRAFNVTVARADDDSWDGSGEPVADPVPGSQAAAENPWMPQEEAQAAAEAPEAVCPVPGVVQSLNGPQTGPEAPAALTPVSDDPFWDASWGSDPYSSL